MEPSSSPETLKLATKKFDSIKDPRRPRTRLHPLSNVLTIALCGTIAGAEGWDEIADFARARREWFGSFLDLKHGTPSADTIRRVFERLNPEHFAESFMGWVRALAVDLTDEVVAIDGKTLRGKIVEAGVRSNLHLVHVWATEQRLLLAQKSVDGAPGEPAAIPELLKLLQLEGAIVTTDANGCNANTMEAVIDRQANFVLALKGNRGPIFREIKQLLEEVPCEEFNGKRLAHSVEKGHGRTEERTVYVLELEQPFRKSAGWRHVKSVAMIDRVRTSEEITTTERSFYVSSLPGDAKRIASAIRSHWGIENSLHWTLDVAFRDDNRKVRNATSAENLALINRTALMLAKREQTLKRGVAAKRKHAGWSTEYLARVLTAGIPIP